MSAQNLPLLLRVSLAMFLALQSVSTLAIEQIGPLHPIVEPNMLEEIYRVLNEKEKSGSQPRFKKKQSRGVSAALKIRVQWKGWQE